MREIHSRAGRVTLPVQRLRTFVWAVLSLVLIAAAAAAAPYVAPKGQQDKNTINFAGSLATIELHDVLSPYTAPSGPENDGSLWYMMTAVNDSIQPATRILLAGQAPDAALHFFPLPARATIKQVASSDAGVTVERARAYDRGAYRVTIPPATSVALAIRVANTKSPPSVVAWSEPALVAHNRQTAIFIAAVAGLIGAAFAIVGGLAVMTGHAAPRWAAATLGALLFTRLSTIAPWDSGWVTAVGGPYGLSAMAYALALAAGARLADTIVPIETVWPWAVRYLRWSLIGLLVLALFAFLGVPGATLITNILVVGGTGAIAFYLVHRGRMGAQAAREAAPAATVFALVALVAAFAAIGLFADNPMSPAIAGGFTAAGAVLLSLAVAAGEGIAVLPQAARGIKTPTLAERSASIARSVEMGAARTASQSMSEPAAVQAIGASHQGVFELDFRKDTVRLSREAAALIGHSGGDLEMSHKAWIARIHDDDRDVYKQALGDYRTHSGLAFRIEFRVKSESGRYPWFELRATMLGTGPQATRCLGLVADVTTRKETEAASADRTLRDPLTGLGNRIALMEDLELLGPAMKQAAFVILDIDRFKSIHASLGDDGGDQVLVAVAQRLTKRFSNVAKIFRVGGDSFAVLYSHSPGEPLGIGTDLVEACKAPLALNGRNIFAPASAGVALGRDAEDPLNLLRNAELALMQAKRQGGGSARVYSQDMQSLAPGDAVALESDLRRALQDNQIDVFYQPIMRLDDETVAGFEALVRWNHPQKGLIEPAAFVAHSEETGLIVELGKFVLERASLDLAYWQRFFPLDPPLFVNVNISRRQLRDTGFEAYLRDLLKRSEVAKGTLKLEITESAVQADGDVLDVLRRIRNMGASLAMDDFGTGVSSLSQLRDLPFDTVKVDKSFLAHGEDEKGAVVLEKIVSLAHGLKRTVVVEGVEEAADADRLRTIGCEFAQGYYFSQPLPSVEALNFIALRHRTSAAAPQDGGPPNPGSGMSRVGG